MSQYTAHQKLVQDILITLSQLSHVRIWANSTGIGRALTDDERVIKFGLKGSADIIGIIGDEKNPLGRFLAIEVKTGTGKQRPEQKAFQKMILSRGGLYILARSVKDALEGVTSRY